MEQSARVKSACNAAQFSLLQNLHRSASFEEHCVVNSGLELWRAMQRGIISQRRDVTRYFYVG